MTGEKSGGCVGVIEIFFSNFVNECNNVIIISLMTHSLNHLFLNTIKEHWEDLALTDFNGVSFQYRDVARKTAKLHILFKHIGLQPGDRIALCGKNSAQWAVAFIATVTYGAVIVPILHEFKADNIHHLVNHSEAKLFFADAGTWENLDPAMMPGIEGALLVGDFSLLLSRSERLTEARAHLNELFGREYPERFTPDDLEFHKDKPDELVLINYTSGSTGFSKGVMLPYRVLWSNARFCLDNITFLKPGDGLVSMLPMAHMYGLMIELIFPFIRGCHIYFLTRMPSPKVIIDAFAAVKPKLVVTVPLIIEKIIKTKVFPLLEKPLMKILLHVPFVDDRLLGRIKERLNETFGGNLEEVIVGGAALNKEVESFLHRIGFHYTSGYGMTECGPLISYAPWNECRPASCGKVVDRMEIKVDSPDPYNIPGVLWVRGMNLMQGYYKNPEATEEVMSDGWMSTGDICTIDDDNYIYLRGRDKNMILGPSGQNIYPEEIEQKLNNMPYVCESVVVDDNNSLIALVYPDFDNAEKQGVTNLQALMEENIAQLNKELPAYSQIRRVKIYHEEFEKTPKRSIKRYLYKRG